MRSPPPDAVRSCPTVLFATLHQQPCLRSCLLNNIKQMNLASAFASSVKQRADKIALFWGDREYSYAQLGEQSNRLSALIREQFGIRPGARVGLWLKNCPEFIPALFVILHAGAVAVPINNFLKPDEVSYILNDAGIDVLLTDADLGVHFNALKTERPSLQLFVVQEHS